MSTPVPLAARGVQLSLPALDPRHRARASLGELALVRERASKALEMFDGVHARQRRRGRDVVARRFPPVRRSAPRSRHSLEVTLERVDAVQSLPARRVVTRDGEEPVLLRDGEFDLHLAFLHLAARLEHLGVRGVLRGDVNRLRLPRRVERVQLVRTALGDVFVDGRAKGERVVEHVRRLTLALGAETNRRRLLQQKVGFDLARANHILEDLRLGRLVRGVRRVERPDAEVRVRHRARRTRARGDGPTEGTAELGLLDVSRHDVELHLQLVHELGRHALLLANHRGHRAGVQLHPELTQRGL